MIMLLIGLLIVLLLFLGSQNKKSQRLRQEYEINKDKQKILDFLEQINKIINLEEYPRKKKYENLKRDYEELRNKYNQIKKYFKNTEVIDFLNTYIEVFIEKNREYYKESYIKKELFENQYLFDNIDGKSLDYQQRLAVVTDEENTLVVAGAGSGKTLTISAKVKYLTNVKHIQPTEILLITFTKKAALEMEERIKKRLGINVKVKTFHALGYDYLGYFENQKPQVLENADKITNDFINNIIPKDSILQNDIFTYFSMYINDYNDPEKYDSLGDYYKSNKSNSLEPIKSKIYKKLEEQKLVNQNLKFAQKNKITLKGEKVKSLEELIIANFLFSRGINYEYEKPYEINTKTKFYKQYKPDFYFTDYGIYLEHFGINEKGKCPQYPEIEELKYIEGIKWKRKTHRENNTRLVETYSWEHRQGKLISKLEAILKENKIKQTPLSDDEILEYLKLLNTDYEFKEFYKLLNTFLSLFKSNNFNLSDLDLMEKNCTKEKDSYTRIKHKLFFKIFRKYYEFYQLILDKEEKIDFNDMINHATDYLTESELVPLNFKYIIMDEFQDMSVAKYRLIKVLKDKCNSTIMAVGDDWQSIYRFTGSELSIFTEFSEYFGETEVLKIENTYRNSQDLINIAGKFIMKNPQQIKKDLKSNKRLKNPIKIITYKEINDENLDDDKDSFPRKLLNILKKTSENSENKEFMLLGRNNFDIRILEESKYFYSYEKDEKINIKCKNYPDIDMVFITAHKSKGLEAENVIIINNKNTIVGFPNKIVDDSVLEYVIKNSEEYLYGEERRLFYVALTRTKNYCYLMAPEDSSLFIDELKKEKQVEELDLGSTQKVSCPKCKDGFLITRKGNFGKNFMGCSNYPQCDYTLSDSNAVKKKVICPRCGGYMVRREGKFGQFYGCSNYPFCESTLNVKI